MSLDVWLHDKSNTEFCVWGANITHNVNDMAAIVGAYHYLWRPENVGVVRAADNIENLRRSLGMMYLNYERMKAMNPENGWGDADGLINFTKSYLDACIEYPDAIIEVSR